MACYYPVPGWVSQVHGGWTGNRRKAWLDRPMSRSCGGCIGCRLKLAGGWAIRGTHEASMSFDNAFITLTFDDKRLPVRENGQLPANVGLYYPDFQDFMKRLRDRTGADIRYMVCGEYGGTNPVTKQEDGGLYRPHYHAILFGFNFSDRKYFYRSKRGHVVCRSKLLEELWPHGNSEVGTVTAQSIAYVARYVMKKVNGKLKDARYRWIDPLTGEIFVRRSEFAKYSLKPGIGAAWFEKFHASVYPHDYVVFNGRKVRPPRYYDKLYERMTGVKIKREVTISTGDVIDFDIETFSQAFEDIKATRIESAKKFVDDNTPERLYVREQVALAQSSRLKRTLT